LKTIRVNCTGAAELPIDDLKDFQGELKTLTKENARLLRNNMLANGFIAPVFIWLYRKGAYILDGHQRIKVLRDLREEGHTIPEELPVVFIKAKDKSDAKRKLLAISSQYADLSKPGLDLFLEDLEIELGELIDEVRLKDIEVDDILDPDFEPGGRDGQSNIDQIEGMEITCPNCKHKFVP
jgi:hypothetical protein